MANHGSVIKTELVHRDDLSGATERFVEFATARQFNDLAAEGEHLLRKLCEAHFNLVVIGEFKRGKSTFINALLGEAILPTAVIPLTSVVTVVGYAKERTATIRFLDGHKQKVDTGSISDYIAEESNPKNARGVKNVEIGFPSEILKEGVRIVDTPGTGSVHEHNTQATLDFLPEADALVFLMTADQPASREELDLLREARRFAPRVFAVQNKIDYLDADQRQESLDFLYRTLAGELDGPLHIYAVSSRTALLEAQAAAGDFGQLRDDILDFLLREKGELLLVNTAARLERLIDQADAIISLETRMAAMSTASIAEKIEAFRSAAAEIASTQREAESLLFADTDDLRRSIGADLKAFVSEHRAKAVADVEALFEANKDLNNFALTDKLKSMVREQVEAIFAGWRSREEVAVAQAFESITARFATRANNIVAEIAKLTKELFGTGVNAHFEVEPLTAKSAHYYYTEDPFDYQFSRLRLLVPGGSAKRGIKNIFIRSMTSELSRNAARLRGDLQDRIEQSSLDFLSRFRRGVEKVSSDVLGILEAAAVRLNDSELKRASIASENERDLQILHEIRSTIASIHKNAK